jgi:hypothetical protein
MRPIMSQHIGSDEETAVSTRALLTPFGDA